MDHCTAWIQSGLNWALNASLPITLGDASMHAACQRSLGLDFDGGFGQADSVGGGFRLPPLIKYLEQMLENSNHAWACVGTYVSICIFCLPACLPANHCAHPPDLILLSEMTLGIVARLNSQGDLFLTITSKITTEARKQAPSLLRYHEQISIENASAKKEKKKEKWACQRMRSEYIHFERE